MRRYLALLGLLVVGVVLALGGGLGSGPKPARAFDPSKAPEIENRILSGLADYELSVLNNEASVNNGAKPPKNYVAKGNDGCTSKIQSNVKVNQNCLNLSDPNLQGRGQAQNETSIAQDPLNPNNVVASYNDYRRGDGTCGTSYSRDSGQNLDGRDDPERLHAAGRRSGRREQYWQAGGDTSVAWDTKGNAYLSCQLFNARGQARRHNPDQSSAFYVFRSTGNGGASWNFPGRPVAELQRRRRAPGRCSTSSC